MPDDPPHKAFDAYLKRHEPDLPERHTSPGRPRPQPPLWRALLPLALIGAAIVGVVLTTCAAQADCSIKGNINRKGERIYHLPGTPSHAQTAIDTSKGERWFCSEDEAVAAGWRAAKRRESAPRSTSQDNPFR